VTAADRYTDGVSRKVLQEIVDLLRGEVFGSTVICPSHASGEMGSSVTSSAILFSEYHGFAKRALAREGGDGLARCLPWRKKNIVTEKCLGFDHGIGTRHMCRTTAVACHYDCDLLAAYRITSTKMWPLENFSQRTVCSLVTGQRLFSDDASGLERFCSLVGVQVRERENIFVVVRATVDTTESPSAPRAGSSNNSSQTPGFWT